MYDNVNIDNDIYQEFSSLTPVEKIDFLYRISFPEHEEEINKKIYEDVNLNDEAIYCIHYTDYIFVAGNDRKQMKELIRQLFVEEGTILQSAPEEVYIELMKLNEQNIKNRGYVSVYEVVHESYLPISNN